MTAPAAWSRFCETLSETGRLVTGPLGAQDSRERAEGFRHLTRVLSVATEMLLEKADTQRPAFTRWMNPHRKLYGDNPRTVYDAAVIDGARSYRISGTRGTCAYLGFCVYATGERGAKRIVGNLDDDAMTFAADGTFELWLAAARPEGSSGDFLQLDAGTSEVMVRQYFLDPDAEVQAVYTIELVPAAGPPPPLTEDVLAGRLDLVGGYVRDSVEAELTLSALSASMATAVFRAGSEYVDVDGNPAPPPVDLDAVVRVMPTPAIQYSGQWFDNLGDDEAIVIDATMPVCRYLSVQLLTRFMESGDWAHYPVFLTSRDLGVEAGDRFRIVVAHRDPGAGHWLATTGLTSANIAVRALKAEGVLDVQFRRLPFSQIGAPP